MAQGQIYTYLQKHKKRWFTVRELSKKLKLTQSAIAVSVLKLNKYTFIEKRMVESTTQPKRQPIPEYTIIDDEN